MSESDIKVVSARYVGRMTTQEDFDNYASQFDTTYGDWDEYVHGGDATSGRPIDKQIANEIRDVKLTVTNNNILAWSAKYKCYGSDRGFGPGSTDSLGNNIEGQCLLGIKYELKFEY